ncbi:hypothetical protein L7F22_034780 [Adiantum nelumboides]|nr:hypothetical protein [Adiantum nelumboides]
MGAVASKLAEPPSSNHLIESSELEGCAAHRPPYLLSFLLAAAVVLALALFCCAWLTIIKMIARAALQRSSAASAPLGQLPGSNTGALSEPVPTTALHELQGATLVLFPGEQSAHTLAVPANVSSPPQCHSSSSTASPNKTCPCQ